MAVVQGKAASFQFDGHTFTIKDWRLELPDEEPAKIELPKPISGTFCCSPYWYCEPMVAVTADDEARLWYWRAKLILDLYAHMGQYPSLSPVKGQWRITRGE
jgi:hypothetical protein